jgi:protein ImuA
MKTQLTSVSGGGLPAGVLRLAAAPPSAPVEAPLSPADCLAEGAVHEVFAQEQADAAAGFGFAACAALGLARGRTIALIQQEMLAAEAGAPSGPGLRDLGLDPSRLLYLRLRAAEDGLRAGAEALRAPGLGAAVLALWGEAPGLDLTASRKLMLAAAGSGVALLLLRVAARPRPSAATTRWLVSAAPSRALAANAPGHPCFSATLVRNRMGLPERRWLVEWNRDRRCFDARSFDEDRGSRPAPLSRPVAAEAADRPAAARAEEALRRRAG